MTEVDGQTPMSDGDVELVHEVVTAGLGDAAPDRMITVDEAGRILFVDRQVEMLFGYRRQDLMGRPVEMLFPESRRLAHRAHRTRFRAEPRTRRMGEGMRLFARRADGAEFPVEIALSPLDGGDGLWVIAAVRDISARVAAESEAAPSAPGPP